MDSTDVKVVMRKYGMYIKDDGVMGQGTSSICRKGFDMESQQPVAVKLYRTKKSARNQEKDARNRMTKFKRQIHVLKLLEEPFERPSDPRLWNDELDSLSPARLFMQLIAYSQDHNGEPAPDDDGELYIITELARCSLKDFLKSRHGHGKYLTKTAVLNIARTILQVVAGLHAKGLVHLDIKPENLMLFDGILKLIDVDGCVKINSSVSIDDSSLSFSPCYCAPEWAEFLISDADDPVITISTLLDVWGVGATICEVASLQVMMNPTLHSFLENGRLTNEATINYLEWLSEIEQVPLPNYVQEFDDGLLDLLVTQLLVCQSSRRSTLAEALSHAYFTTERRRRSISQSISQSNSQTFDDGITHYGKQHRVEDFSSRALYKGEIFKLKTDGDPDDDSCWLLRDVYVSVEGCLCYFSQRENKRLIIMDAHEISECEIREFHCSSKAHAFEMKFPTERFDGHGFARFACESSKDARTWMAYLKQAKLMATRSFQMDSVFAMDIKKFRLSVKNRRQKVEESAKDQFQPIFKGQLWKLIAGGDMMAEADWREREMWIAKNGSLVYWSVKDFTELVYYTTADVATASIEKVSGGGCALPWAFTVTPSTEDALNAGLLAATPGVFAAESEELQTQWLQAFQQFAKPAET